MDRTIPSFTVEGTVTPPCSKSYAQRALAGALLAEGETVLADLTLCDDTRAALRIIEVLGAQVHATSRGTYLIHGGLTPRVGRIEVGESGLATRLFTPIAALAPTPLTVSGEGTMLHRPLAGMIGPLRSLGVAVRDGGGFLPIQVQGPIRGGEVEVDGSVSSQFLTGLLMALPLASDDTTIRVRGLVSTPYVDMTIEMARLYGVEIEHNDYTEFFVPGGQHYRPASLRIEGDWSGAAAMLVAGAVAGRVTVDNLDPLSLQADTAVVRPLLAAGAEVITAGRSTTVSRRPLRAFRFDATHAPDLFPPLAALAANCRGTSVLVGTDRLADKECNRATALMEELGKLGIAVDLSERNTMRITGGPISGGTVDSHGDHRMAMAMAVVALNATGPVHISGAECVAKSYPAFFSDLMRLRNAPL